MGYRKIPTIHTIESKKYQDLVYRMKGLKIGKMRQLLILIDSDDKKAVETVDALVEAFSDNLVSWTLEDKKGRPLDANRKEVEDLEIDMLIDLVGEWLTQVSGPDEDLGKGSPSGAKFPGRPVTMEAL